MIRMGFRTWATALVVLTLRSRKGVRKDFRKGVREGVRRGFRKDVREDVRRDVRIRFRKMIFRVFDMNMYMYIYI